MNIAKFGNILFGAVVALILTTTTSFAQGGANAGAGADARSGSMAQSIDNSINDYEGGIGLPSTTANPCVFGGSVGAAGAAGVGINVPLRTCRVFEETVVMAELFGAEYAREHMMKIPRVKKSVEAVNARREVAATTVSTSGTATVAAKAAPVTAPQQTLQAVARYEPVTLRVDGKRYTLREQAHLEAYYECEPGVRLGAGGDLVCYSGS